jgi:hypothetical protein
MRTKIAYAVFTLTPSGLDYMVKGNFGSNKDAADTWAKDHIGDVNEHEVVNGHVTSKDFIYPNGLFVKRIEY